MDAFANSVADVTGGSVDQIKLLLCTISFYPLGSIFVRIPRSWPTLKHLFSIMISFLILCPVMDIWFGTLQFTAVTLLTYFLTATLRSHSMPWIVFTVVMGHLTLLHVYRALDKTAYEVVDISGPLMVLTMKLTTFAWNVYDGRRPVEELDNWQKKHRVTKFPSFLEFLGFAFYFPGLLVGPSTEYTTYISLVDNSLFASAHRGDKNRHVPRGRKRVAYTRMLTGFIFLGVYVFMKDTFSFQVALRDQWLSKGLFTRVVELQFYAIVERCKYYAVWLLSEGAAILTGLGFSGYTATGGSRWDDAANIDILQIELPSNMKTYLDAWNMKTNVWLREAIYKRVARKGKKPGFKSTMLTFVTSAFWHGFAAGYYLTFIFAGFASSVARQCRRHFRPHFVSDTNPNQVTISKWLYDISGTIATAMLVNFIAAPFFCSSLQDGLEIWRRVAWYGLWIIIPLFVLFQTIHSTQSSPEKLKKVKQQKQVLSTPSEPLVVAPVHVIVS